MKILIVSAWYHPFIHPRAHRWTAIGEYWASQGHEVHVVCSRRRDCEDYSLVNGVFVHRNGFDSLKEIFYYLTHSQNARGRVGAVTQEQGLVGKLMAWFYKWVWKKVFFPDDACLWYFPARRKARQLMQQQSFDLLISVSFPFTGQLVGRYLKSKFPDTKWVVDIGDPFTIQASPLNNAFFYGNISRKLERQIITEADKVVVTTAFARDKFAVVFGREVVENMQVIPPLLHPAPNTPEQPDVFSGDHAYCFDQGKIHIGYFGAFYTPVRTPDAFLDLLETTMQHRPELASKMTVHFYGEIFPEFLDRLKMNPLVHLHGLRPRTEVRWAMQQMDILLNIGNTTDFQLPSKAVDYLAAGKPVVNICYVKNDPFADLFAKSGLLLNLVVGKDGKVGTAYLQSWYNGLHQERRAIPLERRMAQVAPYLVEQLASDYLD